MRVDETSCGKESEARRVWCGISTTLVTILEHSKLHTQNGLLSAKPIIAMQLITWLSGVSPNAISPNLDSPIGSTQFLLCPAAPFGKMTISGRINTGQNAVR